MQFIIVYGVQAINQSDIVTNATLANFASADFSASSEERNDLTFIFFACSRMVFSCAETACKGGRNYSFAV